MLPILFFGRWLKGFCGLLRLDLLLRWLGERDIGDWKEGRGGLGRRLLLLLQVLRAAGSKGIVGAVTSGLSHDVLLLLQEVLLPHVLLLLSLLLLKRHLLTHILLMLLLLLLLAHHLRVEWLNESAYP